MVGGCGCGGGSVVVVLVLLIMVWSLKWKKYINVSWFVGCVVVYLGILWEENYMVFFIFKF